MLHVPFLTADLEICFRPSSLGDYLHVSNFWRSFDGYHRQFAIGAA